MSSLQQSAAGLALLNRHPDLLPPLEMDGYLTGILLTPNLESRQWVEGLWAKIPTSLTDDRGIKQAVRVVLAQLEAIEADLQKGWPGYCPSFTEPGRTADHGKVRTWCKGLWRAMRLDPGYWSDLADDEKTAGLVSIFAGFLDVSPPIDERDDADKIRDEHAALLPRVIVAMRKLALLREGDAPALQSIKANKVGRNQPCPCGSTKKFKRCCGAN